MAKFLIAASYTPEGLRGLAKDKASRRRKAVQEALAAMGGGLEAIYWAFGESDAFVICDCPDNITAAALSLAVSAVRLVRTTTTPRLTGEEVDPALAQSGSIRVPGA